MKLLLEFYDRGSAALEAGAPFEKLAAMPVREKLGRFKYCQEKDHKQLARELSAELANEVRKLTEGNENA